MIKAYFLIRKDLSLSPAKLAVQVGHGVDFIHYDGAIYSNNFNAWRHEFARRKIVLAVKDNKELIKIILSLNGVPHNEIWDEGFTELEGKTRTGLVIHPIEDENLPKKVKRLRLYS